MMNTNRIALVAAILLIAINLRPAMASLGPLLDLIEHSSGLSSASAGLLTTLPVFLMGVGALLGRPLRQFLGEVNGVTTGMFLVALACGSRVLHHSADGLLVSAVLVGVGIALIQALLPSFIKKTSGARSSNMMALYSTGIMSGAAIAAAVTPRVSVQFGWEAALGIWVLPALLALLIWWFFISEKSGSNREQKKISRYSFWRNSRAWTLMLFFGVNTGAYTLILAWLPPFYVELGQDRKMAGDLLAGLTMTEVLSGLAISALVGKFHDRRPLLIAALFFTLAGLVVLHEYPLQMALLATILLGLGIGALFPLSLILAMDHIDSPEMAADLAAFMQGGGYIIASFMPFLAGWVREEFASLSYAWEGMFIATFMMGFLALRFSPSSYQKVLIRP
ncbi:MFS transporter [Methylovorus sp. MP688]|uniref:MFS transporter n=1 Tax=Methylovorus sp. (strain MP688) TaxID=887061 RepID=UPI001EE686A9|nr:MFS transporter [Methylovorus sp. MP688]